ncbi:MAG: SUMF1/EgtB/PvdO family nonheme iron enzyme, partial [Anaerolineae bacterium]|nr:SUMF1/EgtB/PvdO family nonheme iron enzyme [Anaerolineae bacterium]
LLGDPGGGKSTFLRQLTSWVATAQLGQSDNPPPGDMGALLPIFVTLRDLTPELATLDPETLPAHRRQATLAHLLRDRILADLERLDAPDFAPGLQDKLSSGCCLLLLDGLDEVPPALRARVRVVIQAAIKQYAPARVLVTCRIRSYVDTAELSGFAEHILAPFDSDKIRRFVKFWYNTQHALGRVDAVQRERKMTDLQQVATAAELRELAENPMLLTTMAIIHQKEIGLPKQRVRLYALAVDVLLQRWHKGKVGGEDSELSPRLRELLRDDHKLREVMEALAYEAHRQERLAGALSKSSADLTRLQTLDLLERLLGDMPVATDFLAYADRRTGLFVGRGGADERSELYTFPHRTFQEYLAGCYIMRQKYPDKEVRARVREGDTWQLAVQLGAEHLLYNRDDKYGLLRLAYSLCPVTAADDSAAWRAVVWSGSLAALLGREAIIADTDDPDCGPCYLKRLLQRLVKVLRGDQLPALERVAAGRALALLGDPRFREDAWHLPDEPLLGFVEIPGGKFLLGSDKQQDPQAYDDEYPQHWVDLPGFYIARYPVTQAQYAAFVYATGHPAPAADIEAELPYAWHEGQYSPERANQPVVLVTWRDALAYCRWLTEQLRAWRDTPKPFAQRLHAGWEITLPSEAEWEKAASWEAETKRKRVYPWGPAPDAERANYADTGIGETSAVGCFPNGHSPYGIEDLSGNVWEWCRTKWESNYSQYQNDADPVGDAPRVVRGGAFGDGGRYVRCAYRGSRGPYSRDRYRGFRVVLSLSTLDSVSLDSDALGL